VRNQIRFWRLRCRFEYHELRRLEGFVASLVALSMRQDLVFGDPECPRDTIARPIEVGDSRADPEEGFLGHVFSVFFVCDAAPSSSLTAERSPSDNRTIASWMAFRSAVFICRRATSGSRTAEAESAPIRTRRLGVERDPGDGRFLSRGHVRRASGQVSHVALMRSTFL